MKKLMDAIAKRPLLTKTAYRDRVRRLGATREAQQVASRIAESLRKTCLEVGLNKSAASRGRADPRGASAGRVDVDFPQQCDKSFWLNS